ncbi:MAG: AAA family ATPase [Thermoguttaceae bacterium]|jgi:DNA replication protein DnaC
MENLFNKILSHASAEEKATPAKTPGLRPLALMPRTVRLLPEVPRRWSAVEEQLVNALRPVVTGSAPWPVLLTGAPGSGKTSAGLALCDISRTAIYLTVEELLDAVMGRGRLEQAELWKRIEEKDLVVLDELGCRSTLTDLEYSAVKRVLDIRETLHARCLVAIANVEPDHLVKLYDRRIHSRLTCGLVYQMKQGDRRLTG